jgi:hypothetical protein
MALTVNRKGKKMKGKPLGENKEGKEIKKDRSTTLAFIVLVPFLFPL